MGQKSLLAIHHIREDDQNIQGSPHKSKIPKINEPVKTRAAVLNITFSK
jgi:hypothetical protein